MKKIAIYHHLGLGDAIECNGMVRFFAEKYDIVDVFAKSVNYDACVIMYRDDDGILVNEIDGKNEYREVGKFLESYDGEVLVAGHQNYFNNLDFFSRLKYGPGQSFYHIANVPWKYRNEKFYFQRDLGEEKRVLDKLNPLGENFVFVHDDPKRGYIIPLKSEHNIIKNDPTEIFFSMLGVLEAAAEVHCMSSSFLCLIDCLGAKINIKKKFLHKQVRNIDLGPDGLFSNWEIV